MHLGDEMPEHRLGDLEIRDNAVLEGRMATMLPGVRPSMRLASSPTESTLLVPAWTATTEGSRRTMPWSFT